MIWLNPVVTASYDSSELEQAVVQKGFMPIQCRRDNIRVVKEKYRAAFAAANKPIADMRCPLALRHIMEHYAPGFEMPDIHPILIHCALELHERFFPGDAALYITTPCQSLADLGSSLGLEKTTFITWNGFVAENKIALVRKPLGASPIPPGFFSDLNARVISLASKREIDDFFSAGAKPECDIYELLYCAQGCHNGDGILEEHA